MTAVPVHHTDTSDGAWKASTAISNLGDDPTDAQMRACFAWRPDTEADAESKSNWKGPHHEVGADAKRGPANTKACSSLIGALNGARGSKMDIPDSARSGVYSHAKAHLVDSGVDPKDVPELMSVEDVEQLATMSFAAAPAGLRAGKDTARAVAEAAEPSLIWAVRRLLATARHSTETRLRARAHVTAVHPHAAITAAGPKAPKPPMGPPATVVDPGSLFDEVGWKDAVEQWITPAIGGVITEAASQAAIGYSFAVTDPAMAAAVARHVNGIMDWSTSLRAQVASTVETAMRQGWSVDRMATELETVGPMSSQRAVTIARTVAVSSANAGTIAGWKTAGDVEYKSWLATSDERTRETHLEADGQIVGINENFSVGDGEGQYPGDPSLPEEEVVNCRCVRFDTPLSGLVGASIRRPFAGQLVELITAGGHRLAATADHPVLTRYGWVAVGDLKPGDELIRCLVSEGAGRAGPYVDDPEPEAEEIHGALALAMRGPERVGFGDLDGGGANEQIDVARPELMFAFGPYAAALEQLSQLGVALAHRQVSATHGPSALDWIAHPDHSRLVPGPGRESQIGQTQHDDLTNNAHSRRHRLDGFPGQITLPHRRVEMRSFGELGGSDVDHAVAQWTSAEVEVSGDGVVVPATAVGDLTHALAGLVTADPIVDLRLVAYSGHVYDLVSPHGAVCADSIIIHNCTILSMTAEEAGEPETAPVTPDIAPADQPDAGEGDDSDSVTAAASYVPRASLSVAAHDPTATMGTRRGGPVPVKTRRYRQSFADPAAKPGAPAPAPAAPTRPITAPIDGGDPAEQLHITLLYVGDADFPVEDQTALTSVIEAIAGEWAPITVTAFAIAEFNPEDNPAVVLLVESDELDDLREAVEAAAVEAGIELPAQHAIFVPHITLGYGIDPSVVTLPTAPIACSAISCAYGDNRTDFPFTGTISDPDGDETPAAGQDNGDPSEDPTDPAQPGDVGGPSASVRPTRVTGAAVAPPVSTPPAAPAASSGSSAFAATGDDVWEGVLVVEGVPSGDGRLINAGALTWRELPLPLMCMFANPDGGYGHDGASLVGSIETIERQDGGIIWATGLFDTGGPDGAEAQRLVANGFLRGISVDLDMVEIEWGDDIDGPGEIGFDTDSDMVVTQGRCMGATICPFPAFQEAMIGLPGTVTPMVEPASNAAPAAPAAPEPAPAASSSRLINLSAACGCGAPDCGETRVAQAIVASASRGVEAVVFTPLRQEGRVMAVVASGGSQVPLAPPAAWFAKQDYPAAFPMRVSPDGRITGYAAPPEGAGCHIGSGRGPCVKVPHCTQGYRKFQNKQTLTAEGTMVATGVLLMDTVHPNLLWNASDTEAFYAHTGCCVADVHVYPDEHGLQLAGAVRPDARPEHVRALRGSDVSPDWRPDGRGHMMVALLAVGVSGFIQADEMAALVASAGGGVRPGQTRALIREGSGELVALVASSAAIRRDAAIAAGPAHQLAVLEAEVAELRQLTRPLRLARAKERLASLKR